MKNNPAINLKKADKGTTTVIMNKADNIFEAKVQLKNREHYERLKALMVKTRQEHIDDMTNYSFEDTMLQPIAQKQKSFVKGTTDFISFIEKTKIGKDTILVSMDVSSLDTNIHQEEGTEMVCKIGRAHV